MLSMLHRWKDLQQIRVEFAGYAIILARLHRAREYGTECYRIAGAEQLDLLTEAKLWIKQNLDLLILSASVMNTIGVVIS